MTTIGMNPRLRYDEGCLAAHALNVVGDRWALLVVRELMLRPKRFQGIRAGLPGITAGVLAQRLAQLATSGVVQHDADLGTYTLTASGRALRPVLLALCDWGARRPGHDPSRFISPTALTLSMAARVDRTAARGSGLVAGMASGRESFTLRLDDRGELVATPGLDPDRHFTLTGDGNALARAAYGARPLSALAEAGLVALQGDAAAAQAFVDLFQLRRPDPEPTP
jgi:DNA-binding HxlR family transcriptional regulator